MRIMPPAASPGAVFRAGPIDRAPPDAALPRAVLYGRETILPESIAAAAPDGAGGPGLVAAVHADRDGRTVGSPDLLRATIAANRSLP